MEVDKLIPTIVATKTIMTTMNEYQLENIKACTIEYEMINEISGETIQIFSNRFTISFRNTPFPSLAKPIPNIEDVVICVIGTGIPKIEAMITKIAPVAEMVIPSILEN